MCLLVLLLNRAAQPGIVFLSLGFPIFRDGFLDDGSNTRYSLTPFLVRRMSPHHLFSMYTIIRVEYVCQVHLSQLFIGTGFPYFEGSVFRNGVLEKEYFKYFHFSNNS